MNGSTLSERLALARGASGMSARELSGLAGLSNAVVTRLENENRPRPQASTVNALAHVLGVELSWLLSGEGPCIDTLPLLDPTNPDHRELLEAHIRAAVDRARAAPVALVENEDSACVGAEGV